MSNEVKRSFIQDAVDWALIHGLALKTGEGSADHCAFSVAPVPINREHFNRLQLATSKRIQMLLTGMTPEQLTRFGLTVDEAVLVRAFLAEMNPVDSQSGEWFKQQSSSDWVLKNQGEGGGHCIFDEAIAPKLEELIQHPEHTHAWALMCRLRPLHRACPALLVRKGQGTV